MNEEDFTVYIVGAGRVGATLARHFQQAGIPVTGLVHRDFHKREVLKKQFPHLAVTEQVVPEALDGSPVVWITVQDDYLSEVAAQLARLPVQWSGKACFHCSGAWSSEVLEALARQGAATAAAHPIYAFSEEIAENSLQGVYFDLEGNQTALAIGETLLSRIGAHPFRVTPEQKLPLHLAASMYSNFLVTLAHMAQTVLRQAGIQESLHWEPYRPLIESTLRNLTRFSPENALTGPIKRGDVATVRRHLEYLRRRIPSLVPVYRRLAQHTLRLTSLSESVARQMHRLLEEEAPRQENNTDNAPSPKS